MTSNPSPPSRPRVLFFSMPWAAIWTGGLGVSTLKAILARDGIEADIRYLNIDLARRIGPDLFTFISERSGGHHRGEIFFTPHYFDLPLDEFSSATLREYYDDVFELVEDRFGANRPHAFPGVPAVRATKQEFLRRCEETCRIHAGAMLEDAIEQVEWERYDIVGFSLMFAQTLASLSLAKRIKERYPDKTVIMGGPACDGEMGVEMVRSFPCVDIVSLGESDRTISALILAIRSGEGLGQVPGIVFRRGKELVRTAAPPLLEDLDWLPFPDYSDYVASIDGLPAFSRSIYLETSRGCWWGEKHLCSFCGLNANGLAFRRKSPARALDEVLSQVERYQVRSLHFSDNILDMRYFKFVLPELARYNAQRPPEERLTLFYETKSNLKKNQLQLMKAAGINGIQPGIESYSDHILELMDKGATGIQQVQLVKWADEVGISPEYGILYRNPNETADDYREMTGMADFLEHLTPPLYLTPIVLDRFSPYFQNPQAHGIKNVRPDENYAKIYVDKRINLFDAAYRFSYDHADHQNAELQDAIYECMRRMHLWKRRHRPNTLVYTEIAGVVYLWDRRNGQSRLSALKGLQAEVFLYCDRIHTWAQIQRAFPNVPQVKLQRFLDLLVGKKWLYKDRKDRYISLPIRRDFEVPELVQAGRRRESVSMHANFQ